MTTKAKKDKAIETIFAYKTIADFAIRLNTHNIALRVAHKEQICPDDCELCQADEEFKAIANQLGRLIKPRT